MSDIFDRKLGPSGDALASPVGDETVILQLKDGAYYGLDAVGTRIWELLKEGLDPPAICDRMTDEYDADRDIIEADVRRLLSDLEARGIVVDTDRSDG